MYRAFRNLLIYSFCVIIITCSVQAAPIISTSPENSPIKVTSDQATGSYTIVFRDQKGVETTETIKANSVASNLYARVRNGTGSLRVRFGPSTKYSILGQVTDGKAFLLTGTANGWYQILYNGRTGYISAAYSDIVSMDEIHQGNNDLGQQIVDFALQYKGYPYVYATEGPNSFDCSGFTYYIYKHFGYTLNRSSKTQVNDGVTVSKENLQKGDLVFFSRDGKTVYHVGLYIGNNQFIHASSPSVGVIISDLNSTHYSSRFYTAKRIIH